MKNVIAEASTYKKIDHNGIELFQRCGKIKINSYKRRNTYIVQENIYMEPGTHMELGDYDWETDNFLEEYSDEIIEAARKTILRHMLIEKNNKTYNTKAAVDHIMVINNGIIVFDSMRDAPGFWKLSKTTIESIVNGINLNMRDAENSGDYLFEQDGKYYVASMFGGAVRYSKDSKWVKIETENDEIMEMA